MPVNKHAYYIMVSMGLEENASYRSLLAVGGECIDKALNWLYEHLDDSDINEPILKRFLD
jgi:ubiquitin carboxyl-terminal hydrolase 5/13